MKLISQEQDDPMTLAETVGLRIALLRKEQQISGGELARRTFSRMSGHSIHRYERGELLPKVDNLVKIALALETSVGYLLGETDIR